MKRFLNWRLLLGFIGTAVAQNPIIRIKQTGTYDTPKFWWKESETIDLDKFLASDTSAVALYNNNFDTWRDSVLTMEVTLDDNGADISTFRLDLLFDNDLIDWDDNDTKVLVGSHLAQYTEGDENANADYSYEVVQYDDIGYNDALDDEDNEISTSNNRYDWLRITAVSHDVNEMEFGNGNGNETQLLKLEFKIEDVVDNFEPKSFKVATLYQGGTGYYSYVSDDYLLDYKVYIDGNWGTEETDNGGARGDITLHPKLVDVEGFYRYIGEWVDTNQDGDQDEGETFTRNKYPYWKVKFDLDENANGVSNWQNLEEVSNTANTTDEDLSDDVIGDNTDTFYYHKKTETTEGVTGMYALPKFSSAPEGETVNRGYLNVSYYDWTYTDNKGYYNIQLPRNNKYTISFWPPDAADDIETHDQYELDRDAITNINDAIKSFNFQGSKFKEIAQIDTLSPTSYFIGDIDGDDVFQLNDTYFLWAYTSGVFTNYTHFNGNSYEDFSTTDNLKENNQSVSRNYYQTFNEETRNQKREFSIFYDDDLDQEDSELTFGYIEITNPDMMDEVITGLDTVIVDLGAGSSTYGNDANPDYTIDSLAYYFTGDMNLTGTLVDSSGTAVAQTLNGDTFYRWGNGNPPATWNRTSPLTNNRMSMKSLLTNHDVLLSFPADSTVRVQSGEMIEVPLKLTPVDVNIAGFEFEVEYNVNELEFIDMKTGNLPGPWFTYVNVGEVDDLGWQRLSFGGLDYSPGNAPSTYWISDEMNALKLMFRADFPESEWTEAPIRFIGKYAAGNPNGDDLLMERQDGKVLVWNKYWAFGGGEPEDDELTYNYPNPFKDNTKFQFFLDTEEHVKLYILNSNGQYVGTLLDEVVGQGIHTFDFTNEPSVWLPEVSVYENHQPLEPGVYIFVLETDKKIKANKFTVVK